MHILHTTTPSTLVAVAILNADLFLSFMILGVKEIATLEGARIDPAIVCFLLVTVVVRKADFPREDWCSPVSGSNCASAIDNHVVKISVSQHLRLRTRHCHGELLDLTVCRLRHKRWLEYAAAACLAHAILKNMWCLKNWIINSVLCV